MGGIQYLESPQLPESHSVFLQLEFGSHSKRTGPAHHASGGKILFLTNENTSSSFSPALPCCLLLSASRCVRQGAKRGGIHRPARSGTRVIDSAGGQNRKDRDRH